MSRKAADILSREEIAEFTRASDARGALELFFTWGIIALTFAICIRFPHPLTYVAAVIVLGGRQLALAILMHECSHHSLFATRRLNEWVGRWLCAAPIWNQLDLYRAHHLRHHSHTGTERDPDLGLSEPFPTTRASLARKIARDISGLAGLRRVVGLLAMDAGLYTYSASVGQKKVEPPPSASRIARNLLRHTGPALLLQLALALLLFAAGAAHLIALWWIAWLTTFGLFLRIRSLAEHACTEDTDDFLRNTRTTHANVLARALVAPHYVNYHLEHHLLMTVPCYRLAALHRRLRELNALDESPLEPGYAAVLRRVTQL